MMIFDLLKYKDNIAVVSDKKESLSYADLQEETALLSKVLLRRSLVFCLCKNTLGSLLGYISCLNADAVPVMLDAKKDLAMIENLLSVYVPNYLWVPQELVASLGGKVLFSRWEYALIEYSKDRIAMSNDLALLLTTSGSTGSPKFVRLSNRNIRSNAESIVEYLGITEKERPVTSLPMYYSYGLSVINSHLLAGATLFLTEWSIMQKEFWLFVKEQEVTSLAGVPYTYEMLRRLRFFRMDLPNLQTLTQAGGRLNPVLVKEFVDGASSVGKRFFVMYGQTEATARISYLPWECAARKYASVGIPVPGGRMYLVDGDGMEILESEKDGELIYAGDNVSLGYAESKDDLDKGDDNKGVLHTGDIARQDSDGYFFITGRMKRFVKIYGNRCSLDAVEQLLKDVDSDCACSGVDDLITVFVTKDGLDDFIKSMLCEKLNLNARAFTVKRIDRIPRSSSGKILYAELEKLLN